MNAFDDKNFRKIIFVTIVLALLKWKTIENDLLRSQTSNTLNDWNEFILRFH